MQLDAGSYREVCWRRRGGGVVAGRGGRHDAKQDAPAHRILAELKSLLQEEEEEEWMGREWPDSY